MHIRSTPIDVLFVNWRDITHPEGGGSERYVHRMAEGLAGAGLRVAMFCAAHDRAPADEVLAGVEIVRRGGRLGVYPRALLHVFLNASQRDAYSKLAFRFGEMSAMSGSPPTEAQV